MKQIVYAGIIGLTAFVAYRFGRAIQTEIDTDIMKEQNDLMKQQNEMNLRLVNRCNFLAAMYEVLKNELD